MGDLLLETQNLSKRFCREPKLAFRYTLTDIFGEFRCLPEASKKLRKGEFWCLKNINFKLNRGEALGLIGHNGSGKSTLINLLMGIIRPTEGEIRWYTDNIVTIDQQSGLNPLQTGRENIYNKLSLHGLSTRKIVKEIDGIIQYSGISDFIDAPLGTYSAGMRLRLVFSIYTRLRPDVFIIDEALGVGDMRFQEKFASFLRNYLDSGGSIILVSHHLYQIQSLCHRCLILDQGQIISQESTEKAMSDYYELMQIKTQRESMLEPLFCEETKQLLTETKEEYGLVKILDLKITPLNTEQIQSGGKVLFELICDSPIKKPSVAPFILISFGNSNHLAVMQSGEGDRLYSLEIGINKFSCVVEELPLMPGKYEIITAIKDIDSKATLTVKGLEDLPFIMEVKNYQNSVLQLSQALKTSIYISAKWS
ncbi:ABC transporter ATP binding subunit [Geminocystis sp. NIES-3708]|uniref:ABC transporter ATP-binding protein n=1 Tax=Geminocystis sp. NIES-3708 TaxID=1615909 RepID=UPI0005FC816E|nr:ATP-binding cassette domain-containing protein [Geminocystis sp. NIES-3708]BAQ61791.1 ABC transporter ATP binding subunit [Geminocystis sp. NIES-3708]